MFKIIEGFLEWILSPIIAVLNFPQIPVEFVDTINAGIEYMIGGLGILNWFCPLALIAPAVVTFLGVWTVKHGYDMVIWILGKIPFIGVK